MFLFKKKYKDYSDETLVPMLVQGDERAFAELYDRYGTRMQQYFYRMMNRNEEKANDFTQDLFLKLIEKGASYDPSRKFSTWFYTVAGNMCKNEYRSQSRRGPTESLSDGSIRQLADPGMTDPYFSNTIDKAHFEEALRLAIDQLEWPHQQCFILRYQEGLSIKEIAAIADCPEGTIKSRLYYAVKKLTQRLKIFKPGASEETKRNKVCTQSMCDEK